MTDRQRNGFVLLLVIGLVLGSLIVVAGIPGAVKAKKTVLGLDLKGGVELVYEGLPSAQSKVTPTALQRAVDIMRSRVDQLGVAEPEIQTTGGNEITVGLPNVSDTSRAEQEVGATAQLYFYDWEANALTPNGKTVASQLQSQDPTAISISQGNGSTLSPGDPGAGSTGLYQAVQLASKQPYWASSTNSRITTQYWMFGAPGSAACATAAKDAGTVPVAGQHCLLSGPDDSLDDLNSGLPNGVTASEGQVLTIQRGWVVLEAVPADFSHPTPITDPSAQFFVLKDNVALRGSDITNPQESSDPSSGEPDVTFGFSSKGKTEFQNVTAQIARRGALVSGLGQSLYQHFAVALGGLTNQLITVPYIDYKTYPDGINGDNGADISGSFTINSATDLANELRLGALPINLKLISEEQVSATLGSSALHNGLVAGAVGLLVVAIFLIAYYRLLGVIAVAGLAVYGLYFFALIKLIPITLTLPGIAGLILTIGVAADANVVIFERVKEEIRAGRSIRQGIATGYKKGLTAIIDANVVTIMTAFILFVLATADVQGFAFTLGIGTFVSLFTAVMATQAILSTMGSSRAIRHKSALGAGGEKRAWRFDFMGASKYFFTMSGVILTIGALAIGGRGLNLGIDFTSGTRITVGLEQAATQHQVSSLISSLGISSPTVQKLTGDKTFGANAYQISFKKLPSGGRAEVENALQNKFGIADSQKAFSYTSVGPTFGSAVADSAVIAIIASLLVICAYVALRFEWKFSIPVMIALAHDLLITTGVYALTGRQVTADTVAALLTILGYSMYDTIIVFDRVRENIPRMPRAAFSQIVNRSMSEVLTRSIATTSCTLMPIVALLLFGGTPGSTELTDFAFALLIGVASGAYSSIFIASPVLMHWKERESQYRHRRARIESELGYVPAYADRGADVEPTVRRQGRGGRLTEPQPDGVSAAEFEQMKRDIAEEEQEPRHRTSTLTKRLARTSEEDAPAPPTERPSRGGRASRRAASDGPGGAGPGAGGGRTSGTGGRSSGTGGRSSGTGGRSSSAGGRPSAAGGRSGADGGQSGAAADRDRARDPRARDGADGAGIGTPPPEAGNGAPPPDAGAESPAEEVRPAPDIAENEGMAPAPQKRPPKPRSRNRRHGRRR
ncbi:MAG TPA: protein translocase subunit SecD [Solirubrobacteraceae bacterium]|nr:protein translocase subunit SecD [Solirubrobacteraceae bacterium]